MIATTGSRRSSSKRFDSPEQEAFLNLWRTYERLRALEDELFRRFDLTPQQYNVLRLLRAVHPDAVPTLELADRLVSRAPDITRMLDKLEQRGVLTRKRSEADRRVVHLRLTAAGDAVAKKVPFVLAAVNNDFLRGFTEAEWKQLRRLLSRMADNGATLQTDSEAA